MITFHCPQCGKKYTVKNEFGGRETACHSCRTKMIVPVSISAVLVEPGHAQTCSRCRSRCLLGKADGPDGLCGPCRRELDQEIVQGEKKQEIAADLQHLGILFAKDRDGAREGHRTSSQPMIVPRIVFLVLSMMGLFVVGFLLIWIGSPTAKKGVPSISPVAGDKPKKNEVVATKPEIPVSKVIAQVNNTPKKELPVKPVVEQPNPGRSGHQDPSIPTDLIDIYEKYLTRPDVAINNYHKKFMKVRGIVHESIVTDFGVVLYLRHSKDARELRYKQRIVVPFVFGDAIGKDWDKGFDWRFGQDRTVYLPWSNGETVVFEAILMLYKDPENIKEIGLIQAKLQ